jgi:hypothetical protein
MMPVFAFLDPDSITQFLIKALAVGGGFLVGYMAAWVGARLVDRWTFGGRMPEQLHLAARLVGGLLLALLVAILVFGKGGDGFGLGGGPGEGGGTASTKTGEEKGTGPDVPTKIDPVPSTVPTSKDPVLPEQRVRVTLLGGEDVREEKFYLLGDDRTPLDLPGLTAALKSRKESAARPLGIEVRFTSNNTLPRTHPAVLRLTAWAQANGYPVTFPAK